MLLYVLSYLVVILEVLGCKLFFEIFAKERKLKNGFIVGGYILTLASIDYLISILYDQIFVFKELFVIIAISICMFALFKTSILKAIFLSFLYQGLILLVDYLTMVMSIYLFESASTIDETHFLTGTLIIVLSKTILLFIVLLIKRYIEMRDDNNLTDQEWLRFLFFPVFTICTIIAMRATSEDIQNQKAESIFCVIAFGLVGMNIVVFYLIHDILLREQKVRENEILKENNKNQMVMYESISRNFDKQQRNAHEFKNHMLCIDSLLESKEYDEVRKYVDQICVKMDHKADFINTNHIIVNAIVNAKYQETFRKDIIFILKINDLSKIKLKDEDVVLILSNLLNNAIEACEKCKKEKWIKLKFVREKDATIISVKNTYESNVVMKAGNYITTKLNQDMNHGIGIRNITEAIERYKGSYVIKRENNEFYFSIIIPN